MADDDSEVFSSSVGLLPHHEDQPFLGHMRHDAHQERHRNTKDYVAETHTPKTNRRNAGILLRRMSDDFNVRKFPEVVEEVKVRRRAQSEGSVEPLTPRQGAPAKVLRLVRTLSSTAMTPDSSRNPVLPPPPQAKHPPALLESEEESYTGN